MTELGVVYRNIKRADRVAADALAPFGSATVHEAMGRVGLIKPYMRPIYAGAQMSGTAVTVLLHPGDNWMMHVVAEQIHPGDVVVADDDGVVVVRRKDAGEVVAKGEKRQADEEGKRQMLASGVLGLDMYKMREPLEKAGLVYVDEPESD